MSVIFATSLTVSITLSLAGIHSLYFGVPFDLLYLIPVSWIVTAVCFVFRGFLYAIEQGD